MGHNQINVCARQLCALNFRIAGSIIARRPIYWQPETTWKRKKACALSVADVDGRGACAIRWTFFFFFNIYEKCVASTRENLHKYFLCNKKNQTNNWIMYELIFERVRSTLQHFFLRAIICGGAGAVVVPSSSQSSKYLKVYAHRLGPFHCKRNEKDKKKVEWKRAIPRTASCKHVRCTFQHIMSSCDAHSFFFHTTHEPRVIFVRLNDAKCTAIGPTTQSQNYIVHFLTV